MTDKYQQLSLAFAGIAQAVTLVNHLAQEGKIIDNAAYEACIYSLLQIDAPNTETIFKDLSHLKLGMEKAIAILQGNSDKNMLLITRYLLGLFHLEKKLRKDVALSKKLGAEIDKAAAQKDFFPLLHENVIARFADIYVNTLGTFNYRLHIIGDALYLKNSDTVNKIRSLLLAGIRATVLWQQLGGSRWTLFFSRKKLIQALQNYLKQI